MVCLVSLVTQVLKVKEDSKVDPDNRFQVNLVFLESLAEMDSLELRVTPVQEVYLVFQETPQLDDRVCLDLRENLDQEETQVSMAYQVYLEEMDQKEMLVDLATFVKMVAKEKRVRLV